ncbi:hypothetical protein [Spongiactinospora sp. TRM90649]|uniref:hypothetical protein n=1 Tax=Spongiactinospora sp. TRM90649 TaxID=3031114 RepID=UPI0023F902A2|nr:hypothetical protein [Spongiactinospora sp. TRM90649]MDF5753002.1 hypothetical protein [Spongiactinospora sp. TRM90649]
MAFVRSPLALVGASVLLTVVIGLLGPSAMVPVLEGPAWQPPYSLGLRPAGPLVIAMAAVALVLGAAGLALALRAARLGRLPVSAVWLTTAGCVAAVVLALLPPSGSSDHLNYAAYGRIAALGHDPYVTSAADLPEVAGWVQEWLRTPSVYGPVATAVQMLAGFAGGGSVRLTVFALEAVNALAFVGTAVLLHRLTRGDARAALLWAANPLVLYHLAAGMHVDTLAVVAVVAALALGVTTAARGAGTGALLGLAMAVKVNAGLVALGPAWVMRRAPRRLALVAGVATATLAGAYAMAGPHALDQLQRAGRQVSQATPWNMLQAGLQALLGPGGYVIWIQVGSLVLMAALAVLLLRAMPELGAAHVAAAVVVAYLFTAPYALPWYDGLAFALVAMIPASALDGFLVTRLVALSLAYLPARVVDQPESLIWLRTVVRPQVVPWILLAVTAALAVWAWRSARRGAAAPAPTPPVSAAPRP